MKIKLTALLVACLCFALCTANAQTLTAKITGHITDNTNRPIDGATVNLLAAKDSSTVKSLLANADGSFAFADVKDGSYRVGVTYVGFKNYKSNIIIVANQKSVSLPPIALTSTNTTLKEVGVTAQKSYVEQKIDRTVVNVGALISNTGISALEVLEKTPGVSVDENGTVSFKGKTGVLIMIDDKPTYLSAASLATYLRSLPSSSLDQIELMDNPPAKYDAAGTAGVINIKTKKNTIKGFNGSVSASAAQGFYQRTSESLNMNYRINKVNVFANFSYGHGKTFRRLEIDRTYLDGGGNPTSSITNTSYFKPTNYYVNAKVGMDFFKSANTTWGVVFTGGISPNYDSSPVYSSSYNKIGALDSTNLALNTSRDKLSNGGVNLNYTHKFDNVGKVITFDADYIRNLSSSDQSFLNNAFFANGAPKQSQTLTDNLPGSVNIYAAKTDFSTPLKNHAKFEAGVKTSYVNTDNAANYFNVFNGVSSINYNNTNRFLYAENINAAYVNYNQTFNRFGVQFGLRAENTNSHGHQLGNAQKPDSSFTRHYTDLFPTAYLSYKLDTAGHHTLVASYGRRIGRPNYSSLNPFIFFIDKFSEFAGNPFLRPQFTDVYKLAYSYKSFFTIALTYNYTIDNETEIIYQQNGIFVSTTGNIGQTKNLDLSVNTNLQPAKWWSLNLYAEVFNASYVSPLTGGAYLNNSGYTFTTNGNNQFTLGKGWSAELSGSFNTARYSSQFVTIPTGQLNTGLQKKVMQNKGSIRLSARDMLHSYTSSGTIRNIANTAATYSNYFDNRVTTLTFTYNFGKSVNTPAKRAVGSADSEQGRAH